MARPLTIGTAGHVDHGKTELVRALTGHDTDRLPDEKRRGISIELGYAPLEIGSRRFSVVDVPGHERLIRTMISGASGIDLFLLVVAADEGVMPQTREHLTVLRALGIDRGAVALNKCDAADARARRSAEEQLRELLPEVEVVAVSARSGSGLAALTAAIERAVSGLVGPAAEEPREEGVVLHLDRAFSVAGRGTVATGTLRSGTIAAGDRLMLLPSRREVRVREVQVHDSTTRAARPGQRVALNLAGVRMREVRPGDVVTSFGSALAPTYRLDVELDPPDRDLGDGERVVVHHGTRRAPARIILLADDLAQLRLEGELVAAEGDRFVIRRRAPADTVGGGRVLDPHPPRHRGGPHLARLRALQRGEKPEEPVRSSSEGERRGSASRLRPPSQDSSSIPAHLSARALELLRADGATPRSVEELAEAMEVDVTEARAVLEGLDASGEVVRVKPHLYYPRAELAGLRARIVELLVARDSLSLGEARDALGLSRRYALALLEHLDRTKVTLRQGDARVLRRPEAESASPASMVRPGRQGSGGPSGLQSQ